MKLTVRTFRSRLARRWFWPLLIAIAVPLTATGVAVYAKLASDLVIEAEGQLRDRAKFFGLVALENLRRVELTLQAHLYDGQALPPDLDVDWLKSPATNSAIDPNEALIVAELNQLALAQSRTAIIAARIGGVSRIYFGLLQPKSNELSVASVVVDEVVIDPVLLPTRMRLCVSTARAHLGCFEDSATADKAVDDGFATASWSLFVGTSFAGPDWQFQVQQPDRETLVIRDGLAKTLLPGLGIVLVLALLAGIRQVRKTLEPVEHLTEVSRRLAGGEREARVSIETNDELQQLGSAFNRMAIGLGQQLDAMEIFAGLDRRLIEGANLDEVVRSILEALNVLYTDYDHCLILSDDTEESYLMRYSGDALAHFEKKRLDLSFGNIAGTSRYSVPGKTSALPAIHPLRAALGLDNQRVEATFITAGKGYSGMLLSRPLKSEDDPSQQSNYAAIVQRLSAAFAAIKSAEDLYDTNFKDAVTGLPNRRLLVEKLNEAIASVQHTNKRGVLFHINVDRFRHANDLIGFDSASELLQQLAGRLSNLMSTSGTVARIGGDEFGMLLPLIQSDNLVEATARQVLREIARPLQIGDQPISLTASVGVSLFPTDGVKASDVMGHAAKAMASAKQGGGDRIRFFDARLDADVLRRGQIELALRVALKTNKGFRLMYQPKLCCLTGKPTGAEALLRWYDDVLGEVSPAEFIPIAETTGLIGAIGTWVMQTVAADFNDVVVAADQTDFSIALNVSSKQFADPYLVRVTEKAFNTHGIPPGRIELEVTETAAGTDELAIIEVLGELRSLGFSVAIDDFGTGYSSFARIVGLPFDVLKIDRSFVMDICRDDKRRQVVASIIRLAHDLGKKVVAEGVENDETFDLLRSLGCDISQGYLHAAPMSKDALCDYLARVGANNAPLGPRLALIDSAS